MSDMKEKEYDLRGRRRIYTDAEAITEDNIFEELSNAVIKFCKPQEEIKFLLDYEKGIQPLKREKKIRSDINIKVSDNVANQVVEFKLGYNWGNPIIYVQRGNTDLNNSTEEENSKQDTAVSMLNAMNDCEFAFAKDQDLARYVEITGIGFQMVDVKPIYDGLSAFDLVTLNPLSTFCIYRNTAKQEKIAGVTFRTLENGNTYYTVFTPKKRFEIENLVKVVNGEKKSEWNFLQRSGERNPFGKVPIVEFNRAADRTGVFERQISDMDALNIEVSDFANSVAQTTQEVFFGVGFDLPKDGNGKTEAPVGGQWIIAKPVQNGTPTLKAVSSTFDFEGVQENIVAKRNVILQKCYVPLQSEPGGGSSGSAMSMSSGWSAAEASACKEEQILRKGKTEIADLELIAINLSTVPEESPLRNLSIADIIPKFTRNKTYDLATKVNSMVAMIKAGVNGRVSMETVDLFPDVAQAWADSKEAIEVYQKSLVSKGSAAQEEKREQSDLSDQTGNSPILDGMNTDNVRDGDV